MAGPEEAFTVEYRGDVAVIRPTQEVIDRSIEKETQHELCALAASHSPVKIVLDFRQMDYINSSVLQTVYAVWEQVRDRRGHLRLCNLCPAVREAVFIARFDNLVNIDRTLEDSLTHLA